MKKKEIVFAVCEGCKRQQPMFGTADAPCPDGWTECGTSRVVGRKKSALARWCPKCQRLPAKERLETLAAAATESRP